MTLTAETSNPEVRAQFLESAARAFGDLCTRDIINAAEEGSWPQALWTAVEDLGFARAALPEHQGGSALSLADSLSIARVAGRHALPLPLCETLVAGWVLARAGLEVPHGPLSFGPVEGKSSLALARDKQGWRLNGRVRGLPWGEQATSLALIVDTSGGVMVARVEPAQGVASSSRNLAGEPRTTFDFSGAALADGAVKPIATGDSAETVLLYGALMRSLQMAGALEAARDLTIRYTGERIAFGKPLNKLQAVQQNIAVLAGQAAAAGVAADMGLEALDAPGADLNASIGLAKVRTGEAAGIAAGLAHQAHGAMGFTFEHTLHHFTRRLWSWRDEFGNESHWAARVGRRIVDAGPAELWNFVTRAAQL